MDDNRVENDEVFYVNMVRVVSDPDGAAPLLEPQTFVIIMDDDRELTIVQWNLSPIRTPIGQKKVSLLVRCPHFRG